MTGLGLRGLGKLEEAMVEIRVAMNQVGESGRFFKVYENQYYDVHS